MHRRSRRAATAGVWSFLRRAPTSKTPLLSPSSLRVPSSFFLPPLPDAAPRCTRSPRLAAPPLAARSCTAPRHTTMTKYPINIKLLAALYCLPRVCTYIFLAFFPPVQRRLFLISVTQFWRRPPPPPRRRRLLSLRKTGAQSASAWGLGVLGRSGFGVGLPPVRGGLRLGRSAVDRDVRRFVPLPTLTRTR